MIPRRTLPPLNALRAFEAAGRRLNFRIAAEDLGVSQGAVAQQVRALEDRLGQPLFHRLPRGLALTPLGATYLADVSQAFDTLCAATERLAPQADRVTLSVTPTVASRLLIPRMAALQAVLPGVELRTIANEATPDFNRDEVDIAIGVGRPPFPHGVEAVLLMAHEIVAMASPRLVPGPLPMRDDDIARLPLVHHCFDHWSRFLAIDRPLPGLRFSLTALAIDAALAGQGAIVVIPTFVAQELADGRLVQITGRSLRAAPDYYLMRKAAATTRPAAQAAWTWCLGHLAASGR